MEFRHLRYFVAVAEALNFTKAAQNLRLAQPSITRQHNSTILLYLSSFGPEDDLDGNPHVLSQRFLNLKTSALDRLLHVNWPAI